MTVISMTLQQDEIESSWSSALLTLPLPAFINHSLTVYEIVTFTI